MVHQVETPTVHLPPTLEVAGKGTVEEYDSPDYEGAAGDELLPGSPPAREQSFAKSLPPALPASLCEQIRTAYLAHCGGNRPHAVEHPAIARRDSDL